MGTRRHFWPSIWPRPARPRYLHVDRTGAPYSLISTAVPIFYVKQWMDERMRLHSCLGPLFEALRRRRAYFLYSWRWWIEEPDRIALVKRLEDEHRRHYREHEFVHLCNTSAQWERFRDARLDAVFCNQNCLVDERVFRPLPGTTKPFDAIYDARLKAYKRHELAAKVPKLAILYSFNPQIDDAAEVRSTRQQLAHAHFFNHDGSAEHQQLNSEQVNRCLNACRVGLCLSRREGAMYASIQYLLSGLPVVSTASQGGRDVFFDDTVARLVEDDPIAVRDAVAEWVRREVPPNEIRAATIGKIETHRRRFVELVQRIYDREGVVRRFESEWDNVFFNKLFRGGQSHEQTLSRLSVNYRP